MRSRLHHRSGSTLVEMLIFMAILAAVATAIFPLLFATTEDRLLQQTVAAVESNGQQALETIGYHVRHAERILQPASQGSGALLTLQTGSGGTNPTIFGVSSGSLILIRRTTRESVTSTQVALENFQVWNTSAVTGRESVLIRFALTRSIRLQAPRTYSKIFEGTFSTFPIHVFTGDDCGCAAAGCGGSNRYVWQVCTGTGCMTAESQLRCP